MHTFEGHTNQVNSVCLSADGRFALSGSSDKTLKLWSIATGQCLRTFEGHTNQVNSVCLSADGRFALSGSLDKTLKLWSVETGKCLLTSQGHTDQVDQVHSVCLSQDGRFALSPSADNTIKLWFLDWDLELKQPADWDEGARPYLDIFIQQQTPYAATLPTDREPTESEVTLALTRRGTPTWTETDFNNLLYTLGCAGYGWLRPEGIRKQLEQYLPQKLTSMSQNSQSARVILSIARGSLQGQQFTFSERTTCLIGRASDCNIQLPDDQAHNTISRYHCLLDINPPNLRIRDFGSKNGTYVNGKKIGQREDGQAPEEAAKLNFPEYDLKTDDLIQLGETVFLVTIESADIPANIESLQPVLESTLIIEALIEKANRGEPDLIAIQGYKIVQKLGKGGFGEVYLALNNQTGEMVALKVMLPRVAAMEEYVQRFVREIQLTQAFDHPNIVRLRDFGHSDNTIFLTLEYCEGGTVLDLMRHKGGRLSVQEAIFVTLHVLDGLEYAHNAEIPFKLANGNMGKVNGIVHRDLKPNNLFLTKVDNSVMVKIGDYGLAKAFDLAGLSGLSATGTSGGTPAFIPRQQIVDFKYAKPEVDIWATAATLYFMLTGTYPRDFEDRDPFRAILQQDAVPIRQRDPSIPQGLAEVIDLALRDRPEIYFKSAAEFRKALESVL